MEEATGDPAALSLPPSATNIRTRDEQTGQKKHPHFTRGASAVWSMSQTYNQDTEKCGVILGGGAVG